jgi:hypothetical protein
MNINHNGIMLDIYQRNIRKGGVIVHLILIRFDKLVKLLKTPHLEAMRKVQFYLQDL